MQLILLNKTRWVCRIGADTAPLSNEPKNLSTPQDIPEVGQLLADFQKQRPLRAGSLIISMFGDSISHHGGSVWLGSLIKALEPFGLNQRLVRTSVYRLIQEEWLASTQVGRRSYYRFAEFGSRQSQSAARRIYAQSRPEWDGKWTLVVPAYVTDESRDQMRKELTWAGFGALTNGVLARPGANRESLDEILLELGIHDKAIVMTAKTDDILSQQSLKKLSVSCWNLDKLEARYEDFLAKFRPLQSSIPAEGELNGEQCFQLRTLLVHEYRRILLKDSDLPDQLLPNDWAGKAALNLTGNIYKRIHSYAEQYLMQNMDTEDGPLPEASLSYYKRFGKLS